MIKKVSLTAWTLLLLLREVNSFCIPTNVRKRMPKCAIWMAGKMLLA